MEGRKAVGEQGEALARHYLRHCGFTILETNARFGHHEVDIIARDKKEIVFVEVKTRSGAQFGTPEASVTSRKIRNLEQALATYLNRHPSIAAARIDVVAIYFTEGRKPRLKHFRSVGEGQLVFLS
ncbi:YraN family protein [Candidatus Uhrbacteria bacterium CG10_big_fil_rev_8_21_14_0_10_48_11]|uniref:UPF0102 protein COV04_02095 n=1 Tax=Candidatus Uhrbacteria bacterium CG10_big_fil_rev_8_21_14_0_10_48_11 TaxID=1975037 RepID=A0A2M8LES6_9BACT|nr:MAG: YraN family protein [Candidatus Uhrbacteria bacterium CG10_big_fil_rev_8_21_14_0_10_48_11]